MIGGRDLVCVDLEGNDCKRKMMWVCHTSYDLRFKVAVLLVH